MALTEQQIMARASDYFDNHADDVLYYEWHGSIFEISCYPKVFKEAKEQYLYDIENEDLEDIMETYEACNGDVPEYDQGGVDQLSLFGIEYVFNDTEIHNFIEDIAMEAQEDCIVQDFDIIASIINSRLASQNYVSVDTNEPIKEVSGQELRHCQPLWDLYEEDCDYNRYDDYNDYVDCFFENMVRLAPESED